MKLIEPTIEYDKQIQAYKNECVLAGSPMDGAGSFMRYETTAQWLDKVNAYKNPETVPEGMVQATQFIYVREEDEKIVGMIQIRHYFNDYLEKYAGHIGYSVVPSERRKGYATKMLALALEKCKGLGILHVLITCKTTNEGSRKVILNNNGKYDSTVYCPERDTYLERYWIDLTQK
ncbi:MAG: GNAT family N-acetyltransferase [Clostridia bacterium]|nr:GNAT family N-acetyltransferase [Clostridia bacterium]